MINLIKYLWQFFVVYNFYFSSSKYLVVGKLPDRETTAGRHFRDALHRDPSCVRHFDNKHVSYSMEPRCNLIHLFYVNYFGKSRHRHCRDHVCQNKIFI
jgi:hypothetical protein